MPLLKMDSRIRICSGLGAHRDLAVVGAPPSLPRWWACAWPRWESMAGVLEIGEEQGS
jgi:hypothetical protein